MRKIKALGPDVGLNLDYKELPVGATQIGFNPNLMKTGTWRFNRPFFAPSIAPCQVACPAGVDIRKFIGLIRDGQIDAALESYLEENPFPSICGRVCFHPCESACNRGPYDAPVSINGLENYIGDNLLQKTLLAENNSKRVAIIGSGPAGLACAYFLNRLGYVVTVFERDSQAGGILRYGIPEYRLPKKILDRVIQKLSTSGIDIQTKKELGKNLTLSDLKDYDALFVATGAHLSNIPEMPGTEVEGVYNGLDFLKAVSLGEIKSFAKRVAVIGGGNTAMDAARTILRLGGNPIIYYRRSQEELPAIKDEINDCKHEGIEFQYLVTPVKVISEQNRVSSVEFIRNRLGEPDKSGRRTPIPLEGSNFQAKVDAVILATGEAADLSPFLKLIDTDHKLIKVNAFGKSSDKSIFAGGDVTQTQRTVVDAISSGKRAAIGIDCHLKGIGENEIINLVKSISNKQGAVSFRKYINKDFSSAEQPVIQYEDLNNSYFEHLARNERRELPLESRTSSFKEVRAKFTKSKANQEAERCFSCGQCNSCGNCFVLCPDGSITFDRLKEIASQMEYNYDYCKGCGICMEECPRGVIQMVQEE